MFFFSPHLSPHPPFSHVKWPLSFHCSFSNVKSVLGAFPYFSYSYGNAEGINVRGNKIFIKIVLTFLSMTGVKKQFD